MGNNDRWVCFAEVDQVAELPIVGFDVRLPRTHFLALRLKLAEVEGNLTLLRKRIVIPGIRGNKYPDDTDASRSFHCVYERIHDQAGNFLTTANEYMQELPGSVQQMVGTVYAMLATSKVP